MSLHSLLMARQSAANPIRVGVIGAGKFGSMFLSQAIRASGAHENLDRMLPCNDIQNEESLNAVKLSRSLEV